MMELEFEIDVIGFETAEIDIMLGADEAAPEPPIPAVSDGAACFANWRSMALGPAPALLRRRS